jgi:hypothetical protein
MGVNEAEWAAKHRANVGLSQLSQQPQSCNAQLFAHHRMRPQRFQAGWPTVWL